MRRPDNGRLVAAGTIPKHDSLSAWLTKPARDREWIVIAWPDQPTTV